MKDTKFFICEKCGNIVGMIHEGGGTLVCCGQKMTHVEAGTVEASREKHIPVVTREGDTVNVTVGSVLAGETPIAVYAYCNLHGLWKADV